MPTASQFALDLDTIRATEALVSMEGRPASAQYFQCLNTISESPDLEVVLPHVKAGLATDRMSSYATHSQ